MKCLFSSDWLRNCLALLVAACTCAASAQTNCVDAPPGLVSLWRGNASASDSAGTHDGATPFGIAYATGMSGEAFDFNASQRRVSIADSPEFILTNSFSIEGWIFPRQSASGFVFFRGDNRPGLDAWTIDMYQSGQINFQIDDEQNNYARVLAPVQVNQWQHLAATFDGSSGDMKVYVNGALIAQTNTNVRPLGALDPNSEPALGIGNHGGTFHQFPFDGLIDELSLYSRAISAAEVQSVFAAGSAGKCEAGPSISSPQVFAFWPLAAAPGETVSITGNNFGVGLENNVVYFGAVKAAVIEANSTNLVVEVPAGATFSPITVTANSRIACSPKPFQPTFSGWNSTISAHSLTNVGNLAAGDGPTHLVIADLDGDGKPDLATADGLSHTVSLYRNISTPDQLSPSSFDTRVTLPGVQLTTVPYKVEAADVDGDGKLDLLTVNREANTISVYRNVSAPGTLGSNSFAPRFDLDVDLLPLAVAARDLDADGRPEIITANFSGHSISVLKNQGSPGNLDASSFAPAVNFPVGAGAANLACGDLDDDGWPDIAVVNFNEFSLSVLKNQGYTGLITNTSFAPRVDFPAPLNCEGIALGDIDGDGRLDLVFGSSESGRRLCVMRNATTSGTITTNSFEPRLDFPTGGWTHTVGLSDLNGDARLDIVAVSEIASQLLVLQNASSLGSLTSTSLLNQVSFSTGWNPWGVSIGDLDADQRPDIAFCNAYDDTITIYKNGTPFSPTEPGCAFVPGLISWWRAESNALNDAGIDHGTLAGSVQFTPGKVGQAFDLSTGYITIPDRDMWAFGGNDFTIELWARFNSGIANSLEHPYGGLLIGNDEGPFWVNKWFFAYGGGVLSFHINDPTNGPVWLAQTPFTPSANDWYHLAILRQSNTFSIYINGTLAGTDTSSRLVPNASAPLTIGYSEGFGFSGALDEVSIFNRALSPTDLMSIYAAGANGKCSVPPVLPTVSRLINIDFGAGNAPSDKTGPAAIGESQFDFWNFVTRDGPGGSWLSFTSLTNLKSANGALTSVGITVTNGPGAWGNGSTDPMYVSYIYPFDGGSMLITITNLPTGRYDVLPYGSDGNYEVSVGNVNYGVRQTRDWPLVNPPVWTEGVQFARFTNVFVSPDTPLLLAVHPGQDAYAVISGLQLRQTSTNPIIAPVIVSHPTNVSTYVGRHAQFRVIAYGDEPLHYQWFFNGSPLTGRTSPLLDFVGLGVAEAGDYFAVVSNAGGSATSHVAHLEVKIPPPCTPPAPGLVSVWRLDGNSLDGWGDNDGAVLLSSYGQGKVGSALLVNSLSYVRVPDAPALNPTNGVTIEAWVNRSSSLNTGNRVIVSKSAAVLNLGNIVLNPPPSSGFLLGTTTNGRPFFLIGNSQSNASAAISLGTLPVGQWTLLAGTFDGAAVKLYTNGVLAASQSFTGTVQPNAIDLSIGGLLTSSSAAGAPFSGLIDDVAFYNRALTPAELLATYAADFSGRCAAPPRITLQPQSQAVPLGEDLLLTVATEGTKPMKYQWQLNGTNIPFATQRRLLIERVQPDHAGFYTVSISNQLGSVLSASALVKLLPAPTCVPVPDGLIGWWTGDTNTLDAISGQAALFAAARYATGKVGRSFHFNTVFSGVSVPRGYSFSSNTSFSIECWIKIEPTNLAPSSPYATDVVSLVQQRFAQNRYPTESTFALSLRNGRLGLSLSAQQFPQWPSPRTLETTILSSGPSLRDGLFHHVAATLERGTPAKVVLYVDGQPVHSMSSTNSLFTGPIGDSGLLSFGSGTTSPIPAASRFVGQIDEVSIYNRALLLEEIQAIAAAGAAGKCKVPPAIVIQPIDQTVVAGSNATFMVIATGSPGLKYQWLKNTNPLVNATNAVLNLTNVQSLAAGVYSVRVTNVFGSITSSGAQLVVQPVALASGNTLQFQNSENGWTLNFTGEAGRKYEVQCSTNLLNWMTLGEAIDEGNGQFRFVDPEFAKHPACFYRIVER